MRLLEIPVVISFEEDTYIARCPLIQGAFAEGETPEETIKELIDVIKMILQYRKERGEKLMDDLIIETDKVVTTLPVEIL
jgi:predicted RNase H-like HicB family nuclease